MKHNRAKSPEAIKFARSQRAGANEFATIVWQWLRNRQIHHQKVRREYPIPPYTADFCCVELKLIIEIDGEDHFTVEGRERDRVRDEFLKARDYQILRVAGYEVLRESEQVHARIMESVKERLLDMKKKNPSPPAPLPEAGRGETKD